MIQWSWTSKDCAVLEIFSSYEIAMVVRIRRMGGAWRATVSVDDNIAAQADVFAPPQEAARIALEEAVRVAEDMLAASKAIEAKLPPRPEEVKP